MCRRTRIIVIDYVIANKKAIEEVKKTEKRNKTESDHVSLEVELEGMSRRRSKEMVVWKLKRAYGQ